MQLNNNKKIAEDMTLEELKVLFELKMTAVRWYMIGATKNEYELIFPSIALINLIDKKIGFELYPPVCTRSDFVFANGVNICEFNDEINKEINWHNDNIKGLSELENGVDYWGLFCKEPWIALIF